MKLEKLAKEAIPRWFRAAFQARRWRTQRARSFAGPPAAGHPSAGHPLGEHPEEPVVIPGQERRNILFITVDQQRFDALGVNGGTVARTPNLDQLAKGGINYHRAHVQNVVCMPSRATMLSGLHPFSHGVVANGIQLPASTPSVAEHLRRAGYRTALIGKAHFDPHLDLSLRYFENRCAAESLSGPWHGFEHLAFAAHGPMGGHHYAAWLWDHFPEDVAGFAAALTGVGGGDTDAPEVTHNPIAKERYHTDWVAERTLAWLSTLDEGEPWFCWMSFPDPHHPFDPPYDEVKKRVNWRDVELPAGYLAGDEALRCLAQRPKHWLDWYQGRFRNPEGGPTQFVPGRMTAAQVREINAMIHVENELIDEACGRVFRWLRKRRLDQTTDIIYTSDHGDLQGDYGLMFKGPYHVDSLLRVPLIWRSGQATAPACITAPVGHVDLAPTFCRIAGLQVPEWMQGQPLPTDVGAAGRERVLTTFDSQFSAVGMHLRTIYRDGFLCTAYEVDAPQRGACFPLYWALWGRESTVPRYRGGEGELYDCTADPLQQRNLWSDSAHRSIKDDLLDDLCQSLPALRQPVLVPAAPT